ncbi:MAG TPA: aldehyde dehydrogenase family protein [Myxococcaceae bacterium]|nr:aldehyde dehydrogenase family protein [Myxococcaceae bacterium]
MADGRLWIDGAWVQGEHQAEVRAPWDGRLLRRVAQASPAQAEQALSVAFDARERLQRQSSGKRREVLEGIVAGLRARDEEMAQAICHEAGKPITLARVEVRRAIEVFRLAAAELSRFGGSVVPVDLDSGAEGVECEVRRFPAGVVVGIVPFNFPLNLGAHKVAPALAVGAPIIVKPPPQAPSAQLLLAEIAQQAGADPAGFQVLTCDNAIAERVATDPRVRILSFTGSAAVGWALKQKAPGRVLLELGGNAAVLVGADADLDWAAERCVAAGFGYAGQVCIKVQRIFVEAPAHAAFLDKLLARTRPVPTGDPADERTVCGPVIDDRSAERITAWVDEAVAGGARVLVGHRRQGRLLQPTVLADVPEESKAAREEIFGPVVAVWPVPDWEAGLRGVNAGQYGLQAGVFTRELARVRRAFHGLEVGGVIVNDAPNLRSDNMPYGGVKRSGLGREGVRYAMDELTEERVLVTRLR